MWKRQTRDWEQRKFGDIAQSFEYGLNAPAKEYDGTNKYLRITDIDDVSRKFNTDNLTSPDIELSTAKNYRLLNGDILFARTGASVGKSFIYRDSDGIVYFAGFLIRLEQELRRDMMQSLFFKIHYVNLMESIFKSHLSALASPEPTQKSIQTMLLIYQHMMNKRKLETFCIKSMTLSPFTSRS